MLIPGYKDGVLFIDFFDQDSPEHVAAYINTQDLCDPVQIPKSYGESCWQNTNQIETVVIRS